MARPHKVGLSYFPHDTDAANDGKIHTLTAMYGTDGYAFYFILLENIFRTENGWITCGKLCERVGWAKAIGITVERFDLILETAVEVGCFDKELFDLEKILTSNGIKKRIESITTLRLKDRKRKEAKEKDNNNNKDKYKRKGSAGKPPENSRKTPVFHAENNLFIDFYREYPKKQGKKAAQKVWNKLNPDANLVKIIMQALDQAKQSPAWQKENGQYIPLPATWLNGARWEDEYITSEQSNYAANQWGSEFAEQINEQYRKAMGGNKNES